MLGGGLSAQDCDGFEESKMKQSETKSENILLIRYCEFLNDFFWFLDFVFMTLRRSFKVLKKQTSEGVLPQRSTTMSEKADVLASFHLATRRPFRMMNEGP